MIVECRECGEKKYLVEPLQYGKLYRCSVCRTALVLTQAEAVSMGGERRGLFSVVKQAIVMAVFSVFMITTVGTSVTFAKANPVPADPFQEAAMPASWASAEIDKLLERVKGTIGTYEHSVVSESVQSMRVIEGLRDVPPVTVPTSDMKTFPTPQHSLFPGYLAKRYSQFRYTVSRDGIVSVEAPDARND
ncbi:hypothetical protein ACFLWW_03800 [Chloroflexota bacterium]